MKRLAIIIAVIDIAWFFNLHPNLQKDIMLFFLMGWGNFETSTETIKYIKISELLKKHSNEVCTSIKITSFL